MRRRRLRDCSALIVFVCGFIAGLLSFALFAINQPSWPIAAHPQSIYLTKSHHPKTIFHHDPHLEEGEDSENGEKSLGDALAKELGSTEQHQMLIAFGHQHDRRDSLAVWLRDRVRVLCWIATSPGNTRTKALHINATWAPRCNKHVFVSAEPESGLPSVDVGFKNESRRILWGKTKRAFKHFYETELNNFDWFLKADDDTYVILENLRLMLAEHSPEKAVYFGCKFKPFIKQGYMSGGSGYVLSREALRRFVEQGLSNGTKCKKADNGAEDVQMGTCLEKLGVEAGDTRDEKGRHRMLPFSPLSHFESDRKLPKWFGQYMFYPYKQGDECCSDHMISFHYVTRPLMYAIHNLVYHIRPFGLDQSFPSGSTNNISNISSALQSVLHST